MSTEPVSLGYRTDLALLELSGSVVTEGEGHLVITTPDNPGFFWGNFLLVPVAPEETETNAWIDLFVRAFPQARHVAIGVDTVDGRVEDLAPFARRGFHVEVSAVMTAQQVVPPRRQPAGVELRPLTSAADWAASGELRLRCDAEEQMQVDEFHERFVAARVAANRGLVESGAGRWFGAFVDGRLAAELGLVRVGDLARFQMVQTDPAYRRRGLAGALVHHASRWALDDLGVTTLVMVADPEYHAITLYERLGFVRAETQPQAYRSPER